MKKEIILNCLPPFPIGSPSATTSILKAYLCKHGHSVKVIYWNILLYNLENEFTWNKCKKVQGASTLIYAAFLAIKTKNSSLYNEVKAALQTIFPVMLNEKNFFDDHIEKYALKLEHCIDNYLNSIDFNNILYVGFSMNMNQWILASVIAEKIKQGAPNVPIVISDIKKSEISKIFLEIFKQFDIAIWGESETPLLELTHFLLNSSDFSTYNIERSYYRENDMIKESTHRKRTFLDLSENELYPDFSDYFEYRNQLAIIAPVNYLVVEGGRGCHWSRCHFCYLNKGYKYRQKSVEKILLEIKYLICTYGISRFKFVDSDIIGNDMNRFHSLLEQLVEIKKEYIDFTIIGAEVITCDLSYSTIKKMREAGIALIQIGFESTCDNLLKKVDKKNTFSSNLNTIKHCLNMDIQVGGANVLCNLLEETEDDIYESIENLRFFRFIMGEKRNFVLRPLDLSVSSISKYFNTISGNRQGYLSKINLYHKAFLNIFDEETQWHFFEFALNLRNPKWDYFTNLHYHYTHNTYEYKFIHENEKIIYQEFLNNELTEHVEFDNNEPYIPILEYCYNNPISLQKLNSLLLKNGMDCEIEILADKIDTLFHQGLLYRTPDYDEITSIVNIKTNVL